MRRSIAPLVYTRHLYIQRNIIIVVSWQTRNLFSLFSCTIKWGHELIAISLHCKLANFSGSIALLTVYMNTSEYNAFECTHWQFLFWMNSIVKCNILLLLLYRKCCCTAIYRYWMMLHILTFCILHVCNESLHMNFMCACACALACMIYDNGNM